jgi:Tol biopolymer transport system component
MKLRQFRPFLGDISAIEPTFSRDGKWVAYVSYPDHTLWRGRSDGTERMQLTYPSTEAASPSISPDGTKVAFRTADWDLYVIPADGGLAQMVAKHSAYPSWSLTGTSCSSYTDAPTSLKDLRRVEDSLDDTQIDVAPDGPPVFARDIGTQEIYALTVRWP